MESCFPMKNCGKAIFQSINKKYVWLVRVSYSLFQKPWFFYCQLIMSIFIKLWK